MFSLLFSLNDVEKNVSTVNMPTYFFRLAEKKIIHEDCINLVMHSAEKEGANRFLSQADNPHSKNFVFWNDESNMYLFLPVFRPFCVFILCNFLCNETRADDGDKNISNGYWQLTIEYSPRRWRNGILMTYKDIVMT